MRNTILFLGCHCDDIELGCGALVHLLSRNHTVYTLTLARSIVGGQLRDRLPVLQAKALARIGVAHAQTLDLPTCKFHRHRQAIWEVLQDAERRLKPDVVFTQIADNHQDHEVLYKETLRNFRHATLIAYRVLPSCPHFRADYFEAVTHHDVAAKLEAVRYYREVFPHKDYLRPEVVEADLRLNGTRIGATYAEGFRVLRLQNLFAPAGRPCDARAESAAETIPSFPAIR